MPAILLFLAAAPYVAGGVACMDSCGSVPMTTSLSLCDRVFVARFMISTIWRCLVVLALMVSLLQPLTTSCPTLIGFVWSHLNVVTLSTTSRMCVRCF